MSPDPHFVSDEEEARIAKILNAGRTSEPWQDAIGDAMRVLVDENKRLGDEYERLQDSIRGAIGGLTAENERLLGVLCEVTDALATFYEDGYTEANLIARIENALTNERTGRFIVPPRPNLSAQSDTASRSSAVAAGEQSDEGHA